MSDVSRACARCRGAAVVARGNAGYCMKCNEILDWAAVIAVVQDTPEPTVATAIDEALVSAAIADDEPAGGTTATTTTDVWQSATRPAASLAIETDADPFAQRLA